jgi:hypothetical protein
VRRRLRKGSRQCILGTSYAFHRRSRLRRKLRRVVHAFVLGGRPTTVRAYHFKRDRSRKMRAKLRRRVIIVHPARPRRHFAPVSFLQKARSILTCRAPMRRLVRAGTVARLRVSPVYSGELQFLIQNSSNRQMGQATRALAHLRPTRRVWVLHRQRVRRAGRPDPRVKQVRARLRGYGVQLRMPRVFRRWNKYRRVFNKRKPRAER